MKIALFTLALLAQMTVQAAVPERLAGTTTASADATTEASVVAQLSKGSKKDTRTTKTSTKR